MAKKDNSAKKQKKQVKKDKKEKDPNAPKRAISAFFAFQKVRRNTLKVEQPTLANKDMVRFMSEEWKLFTAEQKIPYEKIAEEDKKRYSKDKSEYENKKH